MSGAVLNDLQGEESTSSEVDFICRLGVVEGGLRDIAAAECVEESVATGVENKESNAWFVGLAMSVPMMIT